MTLVGIVLCIETMKKYPNDRAVRKKTIKYLNLHDFVLYPIDFHLSITISGNFGLLFTPNIIVFILIPSAIISMLTITFFFLIRKSKKVGLNLKCSKSFKS